MKTLYEKIGGEPSIKLMVTAFYQRVLSDPLLSPFFENSDTEKLERMQVAFFSIALGGGEPDEMRSLVAAHRGRGIESKHLSRFTKLLVDTLSEVGIHDADAEKFYERIATYGNEILGESAIDG